MIRVVSCSTAVSKVGFNVLCLPCMVRCRPSNAQQLLERIKGVAMLLQRQEGVANVANTTHIVAGTPLRLLLWKLKHRSRALVPFLRPLALLTTAAAAAMLLSP